MNEYLEELVNKSVYILRETVAQFKNPCIMWSTGKDSTTCLSLCREAFPYGAVPFPVLHIDTGWKFKSMYSFRDQLAKEWNLDLVVAKSPRAGIMNPTLGDSHQECCTVLKTKALRQTIEKHGFDAVIVSIRRDEHYVRNMERVVSPRDREFKWHLVRKKTAEEEAEGGLRSDPLADSKKGYAHDLLSENTVDLWSFVIRTDDPNVHHDRVHPLLHWTELEVWEYIKDRKLPVNPLYFAKNGYRYRSLGCSTCTSPIRSDADSIDKIVAELETTRVPERSGRAQDKEAGDCMSRLRYLGYM